jgi:hypothetical protein
MEEVQELVQQVERLALAAQHKMLHLHLLLNSVTGYQ